MPSPEIYLPSWTWGPPALPVPVLYRFDRRWREGELFGFVLNRAVVIGVSWYPYADGDEVTDFGESLGLENLSSAARSASEFAATSSSSATRVSSSAIVARSSSYALSI